MSACEWLHRRHCPAEATDQAYVAAVSNRNKTTQTTKHARPNKDRGFYGAFFVPVNALTDQLESRAGSVWAIGTPGKAHFAADLVWESCPVHPVFCCGVRVEMG